MKKTTCKQQSVKEIKRSKTKTASFNIIIGTNGTEFVATPLPDKFLGKTVFRIEYQTVDDEPCVNYVDDSSKNITFEDKFGNYVLFNLDGEEITKPIYDACLKALTSKKKISNSHEQLTKNIIVLRSCKKDIDLREAQQKISDLNRELSLKCPNLLLKMAPFYEYLEPMDRYGEHVHLCASGRFYETIILSLCKDGRCVSTIELLINDSGEISINSKTNLAEEGKKYNKILRVILTIVTAVIPGVRYIKSSAINPISAWLLIKYSNAHIEEGNPFEEYLIDNEKTKETLQQSDIIRYYEGSPKPIILIIPFTKETAANGYNEFQKLTAGISIENEIKC